MEYNSVQNKFQNLQTKFQSTVQDLNSNIRQQLNKARQGTDGTDEKQYVRIPVEGAKQLRWYDSADLRLLLQVHLSEKHKLYMANAALREALENARERPGKVGSQLEHLNKQVDRMVEKDASVSEFLVVSAGYEIDRLRGMVQSGEESEATEVVDNKKEELRVLQVAQEAQYQAESARVLAEEKLEKFQKLSSTQQLEMDQLKAEKESHEGHVSRLQARVKALEKELQDSMQRGKAHEETSKSHKEMRSTIEDLTRKNESLKKSVALEMERSSRLEHRLQANELSLSKALAEASELEYITSERDELQAKVAYFEASVCELKAKHVSDRDVCERLDMTEKQLKSAQQELLSTAKVAATMERDLNTALEDLEKMKAEKEKDLQRARIDAIVCSPDVQQGTTDDRSTWPPMALEEIDMAEMRIKALQAANRSSEAKLQACEEECCNLRETLHTSQAKLQDLGVSHEHLKKMSENQINRLETALIVASQKAEELQIRNRKIGPGTQDPRQIESNDSTDRIYTKNVVLKYIQCCLEGKMQECEVLLPAMKTVLHIPENEYKHLQRQLEDAQSLFNWMPALK